MLTKYGAIAGKCGNSAISHHFLAGKRKKRISIVRISQDVIAGGRIFLPNELRRKFLPVVVQRRLALKESFLDKRAWAATEKSPGRMSSTVMRSCWPG